MFKKDKIMFIVIYIQLVEEFGKIEMYVFEGKTIKMLPYLRQCCCCGYTN